MYNTVARLIITSTSPPPVKLYSLIWLKKLSINFKSILIFLIKLCTFISDFLSTITSFVIKFGSGLTFNTNLFKSPIPSSTISAIFLFSKYRSLEI